MWMQVTHGQVSGLGTALSPRGSWRPSTINTNVAPLRTAQHLRTHPTSTSSLLMQS